MPTGYGFEAILGVGKESTWATVVAVTQEHHLVSEDLTKDTEPIPNVGLSGQAAQWPAGRGAHVVQGGWTALFSYQLRDFVFERFFGNFIDNGSPPDEYAYTSQTDGLGLTVAIQKGVHIHELGGFKTSQLVLTGTPAEGFRYQVTGMAKTRNLGSGTNTTTVLNNLSDAASPCLFQDATLSLGAIGGSYTVYPIQSLSLTLDRKLRADQINSRDLLEAKENGFFEGTLEIGFARFDTDQFFSWHDAWTPLMGKLVITNGTRIKDLRFARMLCTGVRAAVAGAELLQPTVTFQLFHDKDNTNVHTDFPFVEPVRMYET
jgi:hypothetical protein